LAGYDIIGDIHADAEGLREILAKLGYKAPDYGEHPERRKAIFLGDLIDRGKNNKQVIDIVKKMVDTGIARIVMGNHEFNAICISKHGVKGHIRPRTFSNLADQAEFLEEYELDGPEYKDVIAWFETMPLYVETKNFRVIHACWNDNALEACKPFLTKDKCLKEQAYAAYDTENPSAFWRALEDVLKGPTYKLPHAVQYLDGQGHPRKQARLYWWHGKEAPIGSLLHHSDQIVPFLSESNKRGVFQLRNRFKYASEMIVFIGHYNLWQKPKLTAPNVACLNFKDHLVAYQWNKGDKGLLPERLVFV